MVYTHAFLEVLISAFQFGTICYFSQRLTSRAVDLLNASYECSWYSQTPRFKSMLLILRSVCYNEIKICIGGKSFSHETFYKVIFRIF